MASDEQRAKWREKYQHRADVNRERARAYYAAHREERLQYAHDNKEGRRKSKARYRAKHPDQVRQYNREYMRNAREQRPEMLTEWRRRQTERRRERVRPRQWVAAMLSPFAGLCGRKACLYVYKAAKGCADCGLRDADVLEFDHLPGRRKQFTIRNGSDVPRELLWREVTKCDVVCANCHRKRTIARRGGLRPTKRRDSWRRYEQHRPKVDRSEYFKQYNKSRPGRPR